MRLLPVEFVRPGTLGVRLLWLAAGVASVVAIALAWKALELRREVARAERGRAELQTRLANLRAGASQPAASRPEPAYQRDAEAIVRMAAFDSAGALRAIEAVQIPGVRVTALELAAAEGTVRVELELTDPDVLLRYVAQLNAGEPTPRWSIVRSQGAGPGGPASASVIGNFKVPTR
jgi:hypothetical protein